MDENEYNPEDAKIKPYLFDKTFYLKILKSTKLMDGVHQLNSMTMKLFEVKIK